MAKHLGWFLLCLALVFPIVGVVSAQTSNSGTQNDKDIRDLQAEISQLEARRAQANQEYERKRAGQIIAVNSLITFTALSALFIVIIRRRQFFDKPVVEWIEGRKYIFPFDAYMADEQGVRRSHYKCPFNKCDMARLRRTECRDHVKEKHQPEMAKFG